MATDKRVYYWLKMKDDFLSPMGEDQTMAYLMDMDDGYGLVVTYIAFLLASLKGDGRLTRYVGDDIIRHDARSLARATGMDAGLVKKAIPIFEQLGLIEWSPAGEVVMCRIGEMIGSETQEAVYKRRQRAKTKAAGQCPDDVQVSNGQCLDNVQSGLDNVQQMSSRDKSKSKSKEVKKVPAGKPADIPVPDGVDLDEELPFGNTDFAPVKAPADIEKKIKIVVDAWNRVVNQVKADGVQVASVQMRSLVPGKPKYDLLLPLVERYGTEVMVRCLDAYPQTDWWMGRGTNPRFEGVVNGFGWLLRHWEEIVIPRADALQLIRQVPDDGDGHYVVDNTAASKESKKPAEEEPKEKPLLSLCPKGYTGPRVIVNGIEKPVRT